MHRPSLSAAGSIPPDVPLRLPLPPLLTAAGSGGAVSVTSHSGAAVRRFESVTFLATW